MLKSKQRFVWGSYKGHPLFNPFNVNVSSTYIGKTSRLYLKTRPCSGVKTIPLPTDTPVHTGKYLTLLS